MARYRANSELGVVIHFKWTWKYGESTYQHAAEVLKSRGIDPTGKPWWVEKLDKVKGWQRSDR